ncbi:MAG: hypothetical protein CMH56_09085 [Myxococcales bacterium]|nr:hypothetical protein [Myxococcales bacterium]
MMCMGASFTHAQDTTESGSEEIEVIEEEEEEEEIVVPTTADGKTDVVKALGTAQTNFDNLEYDAVLPYIDAVLRESNLTPDQKLQAYLLQGQSMAIVGDPVDAERPFRLLLRVQPDFSLPEDTPPKITGVFSRVQAEENAIRDQVYRLARARKIEKIKISGKAPEKGKGGQALGFAFNLVDPDESVTAVKVGYRRLGEGEYSSLALKRGKDNVYNGAIPAQWTENELDYKVEFYVETQDRDGPLRKLHDQDKPGLIEMENGMIPYTVAPKVVYTTAGIAGAVTLFSLLSEVMVFSTQQTKDKMVTEAETSGEVIPGNLLVPILDQGKGWRTAGYIGWGIAALFAGGASALIPFMEDDGTNLKPEE